MSALAANVTVFLPRAKPTAKRMTWADIERDRRARGLDVDPRDPSNVAKCSVPLYAGPRPKSAAGAAKIRRDSMAKCACRMCALALDPPLTFEEHARFVGNIAAEVRELTHGGPVVRP